VSLLAECGGRFMDHNDVDRSEEYKAMRQEMLQCFQFAHHVLYWTIVLVVGSWGWYLGKFPVKGVPIFVFCSLLLLVLFISTYIFFTYTAEANRMGSFIAVFLEGINPDSDILWHRCNRLGEEKDVYSNVPYISYIAVSPIVFFIAFALSFSEENRNIVWYIFLVIAFGLCIANVVFTALLSSRLHKKRESDEKFWFDLRYKGDFQQKVRVRFAPPSPHT
jgi:hypothetical protein